MNIIISNANDQPIYDQIYSSIKKAIITDELHENEALPSIRTLAKDLRISVITTKRAYDELEKDGYIYTVAGKGSYVAKKNVALIKEENLKKIEEYMNKIRELAPTCNLTDKDLIEMFTLLQKEI